MIHLTRSGPDGDTTRGVLTVDEVPQLRLVTLEPNPPVIPLGEFSAIRYQSPEFGRDVVRLVDVPGHSGLEVHSGNTRTDTRGCVIVGERVATPADGFTVPAVVSSRDALAQLMELLPGDRWTFSVEGYGA